MTRLNSDSLKEGEHSPRSAGGAGDPRKREGHRQPGEDLRRESGGLQGQQWKSRHLKGPGTSILRGGGAERETQAPGGSETEDGTAELASSDRGSVRPPTGLFYIERDPHSRTEIGERDIVLSAQEKGHGDVAQGDCVSQATQAE